MSCWEYSTSPDRWAPSARTRWAWCGARSGWRKRYWERPTAGLPRVPPLRFVRPGNPARRPVAAVESLELLGDRPAAVFRDGSRVPLTLRWAEILALLDSRTQGRAPRSWRTSCLGTRARRRPSGPGCSGSGRRWSFWVLGLGAGPAAAARRASGRGPRGVRGSPTQPLGRLAVQLLRDQLDLALGSTVRSSANAGLIIKWLSTDGFRGFRGSRSAGTARGPPECAVFGVPGVGRRLSPKPVIGAIAFPVLTRGSALLLRRRLLARTYGVAAGLRRRNWTKSCFEFTEHQPGAFQTAQQARLEWGQQPPARWTCGSKH
ncbi:hypothetical protein J2X42_004114 [Arthrobacter sp. BE255]|nr:hypothetical protein [Arthrobacter sp. BE255]